MRDNINIEIPLQEKNFDKFLNEMHELISDSIKTETNWLLLDKVELYGYESEIQESFQYLSDIRNGENFEDLPRDLRLEIKQILLQVEIERDSLDFFLDDADSFIRQNFWALVSNFVIIGKQKEFAKLCLDKLSICLEDKDDVMFLQTLNHLQTNNEEK